MAIENTGGNIGLQNDDGTSKPFTTIGGKIGLQDSDDTKDLLDGGTHDTKPPKITI